jgi:shikimate kinase
MGTEPGASVARIFLIGYRGSGKTSVARHLAARLGWAWLDADDLLERRLGRTVRAVFAEEGESGFRARESALLTELSRLDRHVIATGGGIVLRPENRALLRTGKVIWLTADADTLWQRIATDTTTSERRPNLTVGGRAEVEDLLRVRAPLYRACADRVIDTMGRTSEQVAGVIFDELSSFATVPPC